MQLAEHTAERTTHRTAVTAGCGSYGPGHLLHWMQWKRATAAHCVPVSRVIQHGTSIELLIPGQAPLRWLHHDPARLRAALASAELPILACPEWQALRVDGFWFNCAPDTAGFEHCH